jgi:phosphatidylglycerophosphatase A
MTAGPRREGDGIGPARLLATFFGVGLVPKAPGTAATIVAALPLLILPAGPYPIVVGALAALAFVGSILVARALFGRPVRGRDPGWFVLDEACGIWIAAWRPHGIAPWSLLVAVALFRLLDIVKPFPIGKLEGAGDWGIVLDDAAAGALALTVGLIVERLFFS